jgi:Nucleoporin protein Ndc1-Nup
VLQTFRISILLSQQCRVNLPNLLSNLHLAVTQLVLRSASEDSLGLVQWDIGVLVNSLSSTLLVLEDYVRNIRIRNVHTPPAFLSHKMVMSEQDALIRAIKLALCDLVVCFGPHLDQTGLNQISAEMCQRIWDMEGLK